MYKRVTELMCVPAGIGASRCSSFLFVAPNRDNPPPDPIKVDVDANLITLPSGGVMAESFIADVNSIDLTGVSDLFCAEVLLYSPSVYSMSAFCTKVPIDASSDPNVMQWSNTTATSFVDAGPLNRSRLPLVVPVVV